MAEKNTHEVTLSGYKASCKETSLQLGVRGSSGMERLHITAQGAWAGMTITATFINGDGQSEPQLVGTDGYVAVPAIATAQTDKKSKIVFYGTDGVSSAYTADLAYRVDDRSDTNIEDASQNPDKNVFSQYIQQTNSARDTALAAADSARNSEIAAGEYADSAKGYAESAKANAESAKESKASAENSKEQAEAFADRAEQAAGNLGFVAFEIENGRLKMNRTDNVKEIDFSLKNGRLEALYGNDN